MTLPFDISGTAFLVNKSRARRVELSQDYYAHHWVTVETKQLWNEYAQQVYPNDDIELSLRNRFFLTQLKQFLQTFPDGRFVNIGAGFTSYPFLIESSCPCLEIDYPHLIEFKRSKIQQWQQEQIFPQRLIQWLGVDLHHPSDSKQLQYRLQSFLSPSPSFVLLEGITYYLQLSVLQQLMQCLSYTQTPHSRIALDYWQPEIQKTAVFQRQERFFAQRLGFPPSHYTFLEPDFTPSLTQYEIVCQTDVLEQEKLYCQPLILNGNLNQVLLERYQVLKKRE